MLTTHQNSLNVKKTKSLAPQSTMATLYIGKGKKDKISKGDILGFLCKKGNLGKEDVGRIDSWMKDIC